MKIIVFSDSHGRTGLMHQVIEKESPDMVFHLGDCYEDMLELKNCYDIPVIGVIGNVDYPDEGPVQEMLTIKDHKLFLTHGHRYRVKHNLLNIVKKGQEIKTNVLLFGHTHIPYLTDHQMIVMNPGSISRPREGHPSYGLLMIDKEIRAQIIYVK